MSAQTCALCGVTIPDDGVVVGHACEAMARANIDLQKLNEALVHEGRPLLDDGSPRTFECILAEELFLRLAAIEIQVERMVTAKESS